MLWDKQLLPGALHWESSGIMDVGDKQWMLVTNTTNQEWVFIDLYFLEPKAVWIQSSLDPKGTGLGLALTSACVSMRYTGLES